MAQHDQASLRALLTEVFARIGPPFSRRRFDAEHPAVSATTIERRFGSWTLAVQDLPLSTPTAADASPIILAPESRVVVKNGKKRRLKVMAIGDAHMPWHSRATMRAIYADMRVLKPDIVIQMGDLYDLFSFSRFPRTYNVYTPQQELELGRKDAELFWSTVQDCAPQARRIQIWGNHDTRAVRKALSNAPELEMFASQGMRSLMQFDGVELVSDSAEVLMIDGVGYHHGYRAGYGMHARMNLCSMVTAHTHMGYVLPIKLEHQIIWELNAGFVANRFAVPMSYAEQRRFSRSTLGYGWVDEFGPRFVPLDSEERS